MENLLEETKKKLSDANVSKEHIEELENEVAKLKKEVFSLPYKNCPSTFL